MDGIIYEDNHIIVVIKPQGVPSQADDSGDKDLLSMIKEYLKESRQKQGEAFCGLVHRLDRVTGGVMVFAKTSKAAKRLAEQMQGRTSDGSAEAETPMRKIYHAVVLGVPPKTQDTLVDYLYKNDRSNVVTVVPSATKGAKRAELRYKILDAGKQVSRIQVELVTGRSHQIRVQMANVGCPVFGDAKYGGDKLGKGWNLALWAHELQFVHPVPPAGEPEQVLRFVVNPPEGKPWDVFSYDRTARGERKSVPMYKNTEGVVLNYDFEDAFAERERRRSNENSGN